MVLDAQALQHLEIVESAGGTTTGTLFEYLDHCKTQFGKRQLKRWCMAPLLSVGKIEDRLDAVTDLMTFQSETDILRVKLAKLPDLEKLLAKIFTYSIKHSVKAIYFEDVSTQKMKEFRILLNCFKQVENNIDCIRQLVMKGDIKSERLIALVSTKDEHENGLLP